MNKEHFYKGVYFADSYKDVSYLTDTSRDADRVEWIEWLISKLQNATKDMNKDINLDVLVIYKEDIDMCILSLVTETVPEISSTLWNALNNFKWCTRHGLTFLLSEVDMREAQSMYSAGNTIFAGFVIQLSTCKDKVNENNAANALIGG